MKSLIKAVKKAWHKYLVMCRFSKKKKEPKLLPKAYEVTCSCGKKYFEAYEPPKRYINVCDDCLPF